MWHRVSGSTLLFACKVGHASAGGPGAGAQKVRICKTCHQFSGGAWNAIGPLLNGVVGWKAATHHEYNYSDANLNSGPTRGETTSKSYLKSSQGQDTFHQDDLRGSAEPKGHRKRGRVPEDAWAR